MKASNESTRLAKAILAFRRHRSDLLPGELFGEPAWELLLEMFIADASGVPITARDVADRADVHHSVMARWLKHLSKMRLVIGDGDGNLDDDLTLSGTGMERVERLLAEADALKNTFLVRRA